MATTDELLRKYDGLIKAAARKYSRHFHPSRHIGNSCDFISEARIAAWRAIETYRDDKQTKLETYMTNCIKNRLIDIDRAAKRVSRPVMVFEESHFDTLLTHCNIAEIEANTSLMQVLDSTEYETLKHFLCGRSIDELIKKKAKAPDRSETRLIRMEIISCLHHIRHKLESNGLSLSV